MRYGLGLHSRYTILLPIVFMFLIAPAFLFGGGKKDAAGKPATSKISWNKPAQKDDSTTIAGSVLNDAGRFEFAWITDASGVTGLVTSEAPGAGELPLVKRRVLPHVIAGGTTCLFVEVYPLLNEKVPAILRQIAAVSTKDLFSVLPAERIPASRNLDATVNSLRWGSVYSRKNVLYLEGTTRNADGSVTFYWKKDGNNPPELVLLDNPGAGELPSWETKLYPWAKDSTAGIVIYIERQPLLNEGTVPILWPLATVSADDFSFGFGIISGAGIK